MNKILVLFVCFGFLMGLSVGVGAGVISDNEPGLVSIWHMDEVVGASTVADSVGGYDGTVVGATSGVAGKYGNAMSFDGNNDYIAFNTHDFINTAGHFSYSVWIKFNNDIVGSGTGPTYEYDGMIISIHEGPYLYLGTSGRMVSLVKRADGSWANLKTNRASWTKDTWYHIGVTLDNSKMRIYVNGVLDNETNGGSKHTSGDSFHIKFGKMHYIDQYYFDGLMDELAIYNRALSAEEIATHAVDVPDCGENHTLGIVSYWGLNDGTGITASDSVDGNPGTLVNGPVWTTGQVGGALSFDGVDDYVEIANEANFDFVGDFTLELWMKANSFNGWQSLISKTEGAAYSLSIDNPGAPNNLTMFFRDGAGWKTATYSLSNMNTNTWYHIMGVHSGNNIILYVNGVEVDSASVGTMVQSNQPVCIGSEPTGGNCIEGAYFNGLIDEAAVYNRALTAEEVQQHYINGINNEQYCTPPQSVGEPTIVTLQGKLTYVNDTPIQTGSMVVTISDLQGAQVWQNTFDDVLDNGVFNVPLGARQELRLVEGQIYQMTVAIDADSTTYTTPDVTFGDGIPSGDIIKFVA